MKSESKPRCTRCEGTCHPEPVASWEGTALEPPRAVRIDVLEGVHVGGCVLVSSLEGSAWSPLWGEAARAVVEACAAELRPLAGSRTLPQIGGGAQVTVRFQGVWLTGTVCNGGDRGAVIWVEPSGYVANGLDTFAVPVLGSEVIYGHVRPTGREVAS